MLPKRPTVYLRSLLIASAIFGSIVSESSQLCAQTDTSGKKDSISQPIPAKSKGGLDKPIDYDATDSIIFDIRKNMVYLYRDAHIKYDQIDLTAYFISVDLTKKEIFAKGGLDSNGNYSFVPVFKDGDATYILDSMRYNSNSKKGRVYGLKLKEDEFHIHLQKVLKLEDGSFVGEKGRITTCDAPHPHFYFNTQKIKVIPNKKVFFGPANMVIEDVPTPLAVPFGLAPIKKGRVNGILPPYPGYNASNGFFLQNLGYYTGLGPYADLTLSTDAYFSGDLRVGATTNFIKLYKFRGSVAVDVSWFGNGDEITSPTFARRRDFKVRSNFNFDNKFLPGTTLSGNINIQTGNYNKLNSRSLNAFSQNQFNSSVSYGRSFFHNRLNLTAAARHSQNTSDRSFNLELPSLTLSVPGFNPFGKIDNAPGILKQLRVSYSTNYNNILNTKDTLLFSDSGRNEFKKIQTTVGHNLPIVTNFKLFNGILNFSPSFNYSEAWFFKSKLLSMNDSGDIISRDSIDFSRVQRWGVSTGVSTNIYGTYRDLKWGKVRALRHTITPTVTVGYNPEIRLENLGLTRSYIDTAGKVIKYNIVNASDQIESGYMGFGISNNLQAKRVTSVDSTGKEILSTPINLIDGFRIGSSYNFLADSFQWSDVVVNFNTSLLKIFNIHMDAAFSPYGIDENKRYVKEYAWRYNREPLHFESFGAQFTTSFKPETFQKKKAETAVKKEHEDDPEFQRIQKNPDEYLDFKNPWSVNITYNYAYNNNALFLKDRSSQHNIQLRGEFSVTQDWKIGYNVGMDLKRKEFTSPEFRLSRELHCWQMEFRWVPNGPYKLWQFTLRPKSGVLSDLKINRIITSNPAYIGG